MLRLSPRLAGRFRAALFAASLLAGLASVGRAQQPPRNPHGPFDDAVSCSDCHTPQAWRPAHISASFDHSKLTSFKLTGRHADVACRSCHLNLRFSEPKLSNIECSACHVDVHQGNLSENCASCHSTVSFTDVESVSLHARTNFPLTGAHIQITCASCHVDSQGGAFTTLNTECIACHRTEYQGATTINHVAAGFSTECTTCHNTTLWRGGVRFAHADAASGFPLLGAHARITCESCHTVPGFQTIFPARSANDCIACHQADFQREHSGAGFPTTCASCHSVDTWRGAVASHEAAGVNFPLLGAHARIKCSSCHVIPGFQTIFSPRDANDCIACHQADFQREHTGSGFPTTCASCHTTDTWNGATFKDHDARFFPIFSGKHRGRWSSCQTCHTTPNNFSSFTCFSCHEHSQARTNGKHREVGGYAYVSRLCLACHPGGRGGD